MGGKEIKGKTVGGLKTESVKKIHCNRGRIKK